MRNYSNITLATAGFLALAVSALSGCRSGPNYNTNNPYINDRVPISSYTVKKSPSGALVIVQSDTSETPLFSEPAEDSYQGAYQEKNINVIVRSKRKVLTDIAAKLEVGEDYQEARVGTKLIIRPGEWRIVPEIQGVAARKEYPSGSAAETKGLIGGVRVGKYTNIGRFLTGAAKDLTLYLEGRIHGETGQYAGRTKEKHMAALAGIGLGLFSGETGTYFRTILAGGAGNFEMDLTNISAEEKVRVGLDPDVKRVSDSLERLMFDVQLRQRIWDGLYGKGRFNVSIQDRENWNDYRAIASELGVGWKGEELGILKRWYAEFAATHRNELNGFFNGTSKHRNILGARAAIGAQVGRHMILELAAEDDPENFFRLVLQGLIRF